MTTTIIQHIVVPLSVHVVQKSTMAINLRITRNAAQNVRVLIQHLHAPAQTEFVKFPVKKFKKFLIRHLENLLNPEPHLLVFLTIVY